MNIDDVIITTGRWSIRTFTEIPAHDTTYIEIQEFISYTGPCFFRPISCKSISGWNSIRCIPISNRLVIPLLWLSFFQKSLWISFFFLSASSLTFFLRDSASSLDLFLSAFFCSAILRLSAFVCSAILSFCVSHNYWSILKGCSIPVLLQVMYFLQGLRFRLRQTNYLQSSLRQTNYLQHPSCLRSLFRIHDRLKVVRSYFWLVAWDLHLYLNH